MKLLDKQELGPILGYANVSLYVYDSKNEKDLQEIRKAWPLKEKTWSYETIGGLQGVLPIVEDGKLKGYNLREYYVLINLGSEEDLTGEILSHELTHLAFEIYKELKLPLDYSEPAALLVGNLNRVWSKILSDEINKEKK